MSHLTHQPHRNTAARLGALLTAVLLVATGCSGSDEAALQVEPAASTVATTAPVGGETGPTTAPTAVTATPGSVDVGGNGAYASEPSRFWKVTNVTETLNVRATPSTDADVLGTFPADARHIFATGELATAGDRQWRRINFGDESTFGWVATEFLAPDTNPNQFGDNTECYFGVADFGRIAALVEFTDTTFSGVVRTEGLDDALFIERVDGTFTAGTLGDAIVTDPAGIERLEQWEFRPEGVTAGPRFIPFVECDVIAGWAIDMSSFLPAKS